MNEPEVNSVYKQLVKNSDVPTCLVGRNGEILYQNAGFFRITGFLDGVPPGTSFDSLISDCPPDFPGAGLTENDSGGMQFNTVLKKKFGNRLPAEISVMSMESASLFVVFVKDITKKIEQEKACENKAGHLKFLTDFASDLSAISSGTDINEFVVAKLKEFSGAAFVVLNEWDEEKSVIRISHIKTSSYILDIAVRLGGEKILEHESRISPDNYRLMVDSGVIESRSLTEMSFGTIPKTVGKAITASAGIVLYYGFSLVVEGELMGTALLGFSKNQVPPPLEFLKTFSHIYAVSLRRRKAEEALFRSRERLRTIIDSFPDIIFVVDRNAVIESANQYSSDVFHIPIRDLIGLSFYDVAGYDRDEEGTIMLKEVFSTGESRTTTHETDGKTYRGFFFPIFGSEKEVVLSILHIQDITERLELQERLHQSEKMNAIGRLAGGVAHDFNNQLSGIIGYAELLKADCNDPLYQKYLKKILSGAGNAAVLTRQLLSYAKRGYREETLLNIHELLNEVFDQFEKDLSGGLELEKNFRARKMMVKGDQNLLQNVFLNLLLNAREAMPGGGMITVNTANASIVPGKEYCRLKFKCEDCLEITFRDHGTGIPEAIIEHIFEPFFTTKKAGEGTGMGLASSSGTIESHGGRIFVRNHEEGGAEFSVFLPVTSVTDSKNR